MCISTGVSLGGYNGTDKLFDSFTSGGCTTRVSPLNIPSANTITALIIVSLLVDTDISTCG